jgi:hypothetical protein
MMGFLYCELDRFWLVFWTQLVEPCIWKGLRALFFRIQTIRLVFSSFKLVYMLILFLSLSALEETFCYFTWKNLYNTCHWCLLQIYFFPFHFLISEVFTPFYLVTKLDELCNIVSLENDYLMMISYCCCQSHFLLLIEPLVVYPTSYFDNCLFCY